MDRLNSGEELDAEKILAENPIFGAEILDYLQDYMGALSSSADSNEPLGTLGDYTLRRHIGRGGMGVVYEAWENSMDRAVALKVLPAGVAADERTLQRFVREAKTAAQLNHENIVRVYSTGVREGTPWYSMEFVEGETLAQVLTKLKEIEPDAETIFGKKDSVVYFGTLADAFADVADGLQHAHARKVIHRDIKPSNLMLDGEGRLRILDFGLARLEGQESLTLSGDFVGTPLYMSPEQARRKKIPVDHRTDVYSLGVTMYEAICGRPPFRGKDHADTLSQIIERDPMEPRRVNPRVPKDLETIVLKCLRKDSGDRYGTAEALGQDLRRLVRGDPIEARPWTRWERTAHALRRHGWRLTGLGVAGVVVLLIGILGWDRWQAVRGERIREFEEKVLAAAMKIHRSELTIGAASQRDAELHRFDRWSVVGVESEDFADFAEARRKILAEAVSDLEDAAHAFPDWPVTYYYLARAHLCLGAQELARNALQRGLSWSSSFVPLRVFLAELDGGEIPEVSESLEEWERRWLLAFEAERDKDWSRAAEVYGKLLSSPNRREEPYLGAPVEFALGRGTARLRAGQLYDAFADFAAARTLSPNVLEPGLLLGKTLCLLGQTEPAERTFREIYDDVAESDKVEVATWVAAIYGELRNFRKRDEWAHLAGGALSPRLDGWALWFEGRHRDAEQAFRTALEASPLDTLSRLGLGFSLLTVLEGRAGPQRDRELRDLLELASGAVEAWPYERFTGTVYAPAFHAHGLNALARVVAGDLEGAAESALRTIELEGDQPSLGCIARGLVLEKNGDLKGAERHLRRAIEVGPEKPWKQRHLARVLAKDGRLEEAAECLRESIAIGPKLASAYGDLAGLLIEKGELEQAVAAACKAVGRFPRNNPGHENLAEALWRLGKPDRALEAVDRGIELVPDRVRLHVVRGWVLRELGRIAEAACCFDEALRLDPDCEAARESRAALEKRNDDRLDK